MAARAPAHAEAMAREARSPDAAMPTSLSVSSSPLRAFSASSTALLDFSCRAEYQRHIAGDDNTPEIGCLQAVMHLCAMQLKPSAWRGTGLGNLVSLQCSVR